MLSRRSLTREKGESLGTIKVVIYQHQIQDKRVLGLVLMSPLDHIGLQRHVLMNMYDEAINVARQMVEMGMHACSCDVHPKHVLRGMHFSPFLVLISCMHTRCPALFLFMEPPSTV